MGNWKYLFVNACVTAILIAGGVWVALPRTQADYGPMKDMLNRQTEIIKDKLAQIENSLDGIKPNVAAVQRDAPAGNEDLEAINRKLNAILAKIATIDVSTRTSASAGVTPPSMPGYPSMAGREQRPGGLPAGRRGWIDDLSEEKQTAVRQVFRENALMMRERFGAEREEGRISVERLAEIRLEMDESLNESLQEVLSEEEYEAYLDQRPERALPKVNLPGIPREPRDDAGR